MDFLNHKEVGLVFYQVFLLSHLECSVTHHRNCKRLRESEEVEKSQGKTVEVTVKNKEENLKTFV
jgi:hypothetical protein